LTANEQRCKSSVKAKGERHLLTFAVDVASSVASSVASFCGFDGGSTVEVLKCGA